MRYWTFNATYVTMPTLCDKCLYRLWFKATYSFLRDFLPRGSGIVTRRPLVLQLISASAGGLTHIYSRTNASSDTKPPPLNCLAVTQMQQPALISYVFLFFFLNPIRVGRVPALQRQEVHRLRRGAPRDRGGDGSSHRSQQGNISHPHQPTGLLPSRCETLILYPHTVCSQ